MLTVTVKQFLDFEPCYDDKRIRELAGDKQIWSAFDILALDIPAADRLWAVLRPELIAEQILHEFACRCAEEALTLVDKPDPRSIAAIAAKRAWLRGELTDNELSAASAAAYAAAWDAARAAAWDAARYAARAASWDAAWDVAWAASRDVAWAASRAVAWDAQIKMLIKMLKEDAE